MKFGSLPIDEAEGALLAHATKVGGRRLPKGHRLLDEDLALLRAEGWVDVVAARLEEGDVAENEAAARIAAALGGESVAAEVAATGRANLHATRAGLFLPARETIDAVNRIHPGITLATLGEFEPLEAGRMVATVKIIPLAVPGSAVEEAVRHLEAERALRLAPFRARRIGLVQTTLPVTKASVLDKTRRVLERRLAPSGSELVREIRCRHDAGELVEALGRSSDGEDLTIVFGASAVIDEGDVVPAAIRAAGGSIDHLGMPVDPGNLLLLGRIGTRRLVGAPGCARSPAENGFDWVLNRLLADIEVTGRDLTGMGVGGLLMEIATRPQPRDIAIGSNERVPRIGILVLAAGRSSRMGGPNKLLARLDGVSLVRRTVDIALASRAERVAVVTGHMADEIGRALAEAPVSIIHNPRFAEGLSTSLREGFAALAPEVDGILVLLADQPLLTSADLDSLMSAFSPTGAGSIVMATDEGLRANPVILSSAFATQVAGLEGDVGARSIVQSHLDIVREIEIGRAASFDVDTPDLLSSVGARFEDVEA